MAHAIVRTETGKEGGTDGLLPTHGRGDGQRDRCPLLANEVASGDADKPIKGLYQGRQGLAASFIWDAAFGPGEPKLLLVN